MNSKFYQIISALSFLALSGCSLDASLINTVGTPSFPIETLSRDTPDFVPAEIVTTSTGYQFRAVIGDTTEKVTMPTGYTMEAVFYE